MVALKAFVENECCLSLFNIIRRLLKFVLTKELKKLKQLFKAHLSASQHEICSLLLLKKGHKPASESFFENRAIKSKNLIQMS